MYSIFDLQAKSISDIGGLAMYFVVVGKQVIVIKDQLDETDLVWKYVVQAGITKLSCASIGLETLPGTYCINTSRDWIEMNVDQTNK